MAYFCHDPLKDGEIRVLHFEAQDDTEEPMRFTICHITRKPFSVDQIGKPLSEISAYMALSYVWGKGPEDKLIIVNGCKFYVRANLDSALRHIRRHRETRAVQPLWVDAICINQENDAEKSAQVALMKEIYATAYRVIVWLGEELLGTTELAVGLLEKHIKVDVWTGKIDIRSLHQSVESELSAWQSLGKDLMKRSWWKRMWVIQEIAVSTRAIVMCGPYIFDWTQLELANEFAQLNNVPVYIHTEEEKARGDLFLPNVRFKSEYRKRLRTGQPLPMLELLMNNISCSATNPRDMIFSLLGLATDIESLAAHDEARAYISLKTAANPNEKVKLVCDYRKSVIQLYTDFVHVHANTHKCNPLDILCFSKYPKIQSGLPSWVPDWSNMLQTCGHVLACVEHQNPIYPPRYEYHASKGLEPDFKFLGNDGLLVSGICFDTVQHMGEPYLDMNPPGVFYEILRDWRKIALGPDFQFESHTYIGGGNRLEAFRRTITADQDLIGQRVKIDEDLFDPVDSRGKSSQYLQILYSSKVRDAERAVYLRTSRQRFFVTGNGYFGIGPSRTEIGDRVFILSGCSVPVILRKKSSVRADSGLPTAVSSILTAVSSMLTALVYNEKSQEYWKFVGESFVTGIMDGEVAQQGGKLERFLLR